MEADVVGLKGQQGAQVLPCQENDLKEEVEVNEEGKGRGGGLRVESYLKHFSCVSILI